MRRSLALVLLLAGPWAGFGCGSQKKADGSAAVTVTATAEPRPGSRPERYLPPEVASLVAKVLPQIPGIPGGSASFDYLEKSRAFTILPTLQTQVGPVVRATTIFVFHDHVMADLRDPKSPSVVRRYTLMNGGIVGEPGSVSDKKTQNEIEEATFDASEVAWAGLDALARAAAARACPNGAATHVRISRPLPFSKALTIRVFCESPGQSGGWVDYDVKGTVVKSSRDP